MLGPETREEQNRKLAWKFTTSKEIRQRATPTGELLGSIARYVAASIAFLVARDLTIVRAERWRRWWRNFILDFVLEWRNADVEYTSGAKNAPVN